MQWRQAAALLCMVAALAGTAVAAPVDPAFVRLRPSADAHDVVRWVVATRDAGAAPFLVVDKKDARLFVFAPGGRLLASTPVLLGAARGDHSLPGVGDRTQAGILAPQDRTTPAGRFVTQPGHNLDGEAVVWLDYDAALAIHRLRPGRSQAERHARLEGADPQERRVSLGCVVVPVGFYLDVVEPLLGQAPGVVYVLPETQSAHDLFMQL